MGTYRSWTTFSPTGISPECIRLTVSSSRECDLPEAARAAIRTHVAASDGPWFEAVNLRNATGRRLTVSPVPFEWYLARQEILRSHHERSRYAPSVLQSVRHEIRVLSSFVGIVADGHVLLGVRPPEWRGPEPSVSAPGGGYLDYDEDLPTGSGHLPREAILREVTEETGVTGDDVAGLRSFGVYEETADDSDQNPAVFTRLTVTCSRAELERRWRRATDGDEFTRLLWLPLDVEPVAETLRAAAADGEVPAVLADQADVERDAWRFTPKTSLLLFLIGRSEFGTAAERNFRQYVEVEE